MNFEKEYHFNESKSFCMIPWTHLYASPEGKTSACCVSSSMYTENGLGNTREQSIESIINSPTMNKLRKDMLSGVMNPECSRCHLHESSGVGSARHIMNSELKEFYEESMKNTNIDGSLKEFKMRYFDIRFSNICNMKCRTCGAGNSSQWEQEDIKNDMSYARVYPKNNKSELIDEVLTQLPNIKIAYFAGGEPIITDEHYLLLEEMIRTGVAKDIVLRYNTNASNFKYKNKDLIELWSHFTKGVSVDASIDHYGDRAEYIRHGTDWGTVESNIRKLRTIPFVTLRLNTVLSVFNLLTIGDFYEYLLNQGLYDSNSKGYNIYSMTDPLHLACHILPIDYKELGKKSIDHAMKVLITHKFSMAKLSQLQNAKKWSTSHNTWDQNKEEFKNEIMRLDKIRNENFQKTFPELAGLLDKE